MKIDPILTSVYARTFRSITDEMSTSMQRATQSPILSEAKDYVTGLYDAEGRMLEQTENLPILAFSLALTLAAPRRAVGVALGVALPIAAGSLVRGRLDVAVVVLGIAAIGAGLGWVMRRSSLGSR